MGKRYNNKLLNSGRYVVGKNYHTKDWFIYDNIQNKNLPVRFNTYVDAYDYLAHEIILKKKGNQNDSMATTI